jgi:hypothetical protein
VRDFRECIFSMVKSFRGYWSLTSRLTEALAMTGRNRPVNGQLALGNLGQLDFAGCLGRSVLMLFDIQKRPGQFFG